MKANQAAALICELASRFQEKRFKESDLGLGKTTLQKMVYFLKELYRAKEIDYDFTLYTYGPFSSELHGDIDYLEYSKAISVESYDLGNGYAGYRISLSGAGRKIAKSENTYLESLRPQLDSLQKDFGQFTSKQLELRATIVYLSRQKPQLSKNELAQKVNAIKPRFDINKEILPAIKELADKNFVAVA